MSLFLKVSGWIIGVLLLGFHLIADNPPAWTGWVPIVIFAWIVVPGMIEDWQSEKNSKSQKADERLGALERRVSRLENRVDDIAR